MTGVEHILKTKAVHFDAIKRGDKRFEVRKDDRAFQRGDIVILQRLGDPVGLGAFRVETDPWGKPLNELRFKIGWILTGGQFGIEAGYVVFQLEPEGSEQPPEGEKGESKT